MLPQMSKELRKQMSENIEFQDSVATILLTEVPAAFRRYQNAGEEERHAMEVRFWRSHLGITDLQSDPVQGRQVPFPDAGQDGVVHIPEHGGRAPMQHIPSTRRRHRTGTRSLKPPWRQLMRA
jgi:hypothetical protein